MPRLPLSKKQIPSDLLIFKQLLLSTAVNWPSDATPRISPDSTMQQSSSLRQTQPLDTIPDMSRGAEDGLAWEETALHLYPRWTREPSLEAIESVCRQRLDIPSAEPCKVSFCAGDAMYKLYSVVGAGDRSLLMKVLLPVYPRFKTRGEVATLQWVRNHSSIPVPKVVAFEDVNTNDDIGFEWILLELAQPGVPAHRCWRKLAMEQKIAIAQRLAEFQAELFRWGKAGEAPFTNIGTLDFEHDGTGGDAATKVVPGRLVSNESIMRRRLQKDDGVLPGRSFRSSHDWLHAELSLLILEKTTDIEQAQDNADDKEDSAEIRDAARGLLALLPKVFPPASQQDAAVPTALYNDSLTLRNILLNDQGEITALLDWECVSAMPTWVATVPPRLLYGPSREEEPKKEAYAGDEPPAGSAPAREKNQSDHGEDELDNEGKNQLYWIHLMEYENTRLRRVYRERMRQLWPDWPEDESRQRVDFYEAFLQCNAEVFIRQVNKWVDLVEKGESVRWTDMFEEDFGS